MEASGGNLVQITRDANFKSRPAWSPDGSTIAYAQVNDSGLWDVWEVPALGGTARRAILNAGDPAWSPDGHSLAYISAVDHDLWIAGGPGENARRLAASTAGSRTGSAHFDAEPRFSPDGRQIVYIDRSHGAYGSLKIVNLSLGQIRQLTDDSSLVCSPAWSPNGRYIFFASSRAGTLNIWKIDVTGGEPKQITAGQGDDAQLDVSSDGTRTVFSTWRENESIAPLDLAAKPGEQNVRILSNDPGRNELAPVYSPDGKYLAYFSNLKGAQTKSIWISNADGSNAVQLAEDGRIDVFPRWTADGQNLVYLSRPDEYRRVSVTGGEPETILKLQSVPDPFIEVGPDGRLLFRHVEDRVEIFDSRDKQTESRVLAHPSDLYHPVRWSPDGRMIAYVVSACTEGDPNAGLWVEDFKNPPRQLFRGWVSEFAPGPQNQIFIVAGNPDLDGVLYKVGWDGRGLTRTSATIPIIHDYWIDPVRNTGDHFSVSPDARRITFATQSVLSANIGMIQDVH